MDMRVEKDSLGEVLVQSDRYWGAQTQRSLEHFPIGTETIPQEVIRAFAQLKIAAAQANCDLGCLDQEKRDAIVLVAQEVLESKLCGHFPLSVWQTGSGTHTNMNFNEVVANRAKDFGVLLHPNDHVNRSQSSNDTFPTAMHIAAVQAIRSRLFPSLDALAGTFARLEDENRDVIKIGRTHLQDATPLSLGQEISGWRTMLEKARGMLEDSMDGLYEIALGGTAVGTGLNAPAGFATLVADKLQALTGEPFCTDANKFHALTSKDALVYSHGALKALAANLIKIANDIRWLSSGPRCGIGELTIPANEPGSSIMPGKVNPTQCEALSMVCVQVLGNDATIGIAASQGNFQLNVYMPVLIHNYLQSVRLLADSMVCFNRFCAIGLKPNREKIQENLERSLMLVTALTPELGYDQAAQIAKDAYAHGITLKESAMRSGLLTEEAFDRLVDPRTMI